MTTIAKRIYELRKSRGLMQDELAEALDVSRQAVSKWEMGTGIPTLENLISISRYFGVTIDSLVAEEPAVDEPANDVGENSTALPCCESNAPTDETKPDRKRIAKINIITVAAFFILQFAVSKIMSFVSTISTVVSAKISGASTEPVAMKVFTPGFSLITTLLLLFMMFIFFGKGKTVFTRGIFDKSEPFFKRYGIGKILICFGIIALFDLLVILSTYFTGSWFVSNFQVIPRSILIYAVMSFGTVGFFTDAKAVLKVLAVTAAAAALAYLSQSLFNILILNLMFTSKGYTTSEDLEIMTRSNTILTNISVLLSGLISVMCNTAIFGNMIWQDMRWKEKFG